MYNEQYKELQDLFENKLENKLELKEFFEKVYLLKVVTTCYNDDSY